MVGSKLQDNIIHEVNLVTQQHLQYPTIGIYYQSNSNVPYKDLMNTIKKTLKKHKKSRLFLVTDDYQLSERLIAAYGTRITCSGYTLFKHADEGFASVTRRRLINCLLLAQCDTLIKTCCTLSACVSIFNPEMPVVALGQEWLEQE